MISLLYTLLNVCALVLINPWGMSWFLSDTGRAEIWTYPRIFVVGIITVLNCWQIVTSFVQRNVKSPSNSLCGIFALLWACYLAAAMVSTLFSPFPEHSLFGQFTLGDGFLYWLLIAAFSWSNAVLLKLNPKLFKAQLIGLLIGGVIVTISIFPQLVDWRIDYTVTSGQISSFDSQLLESGIWQMQMPIGLYSNRGHAAFVLASILGLGIVAILRNWWPRTFGGVCCGLVGTALMATQVRAGIWGFLIGVGYLLQGHYSRADRSWLQRLLRNKFVVSGLLITVAYFAYIAYFSLREVALSEIGTLDFLESNTTGRIYLWKLAVKGILQRPWIGWGFHGFGIAQLFVGDWNGSLSSYIPEGANITQILEIHESTFDFLSADGQIHTGTMLAHKAHNLLLDLLLSTGILGFASYITLFGFCFRQLTKSEIWPLATIAVIYLAFTQTWFESAQFSHLTWWVLSVGIANLETQS